jgi:flagellin-like protein
MRAQSSVLGVAVLVAATVVSLGAMTAGVGVLVDEHAARADTARVAADLDAAIDPVETTGRHRGRVAFTDGSLRTVERDLRVLNTSGDRVVDRVRVGGLVFEAEDRRVGSVSGAIVRGKGDGATLRTPPPVTVSPDDGGVLIVGAARLGADRITISGSSGTTTIVRTNVSHRRVELGRGRFAVALETATPEPLESWFVDRGATVRVEDIDDDGVDSVVATFEGERRAYLVVHEMHMEVGG